MAGLQDIRRRIRSVKNTQQVTKAMKMISAVKLRKSQEGLMALRPYASKMLEVVRNVVTRSEELGASVGSPIAQAFLAPREEANIRLVVIASDKGLCGGFNANVLKQASAFAASTPSKIVHLDLVGKRASDWARKQGLKGSDHHGVALAGLPALAQEIAEEAARQYEAGEIDALYVIHNYFASALAQVPTTLRVFPMEIGPHSEGVVPALLEPTPAAVLDALLPRFIETTFLHALLESSASEHGARMAAMDKASTNAEDMIARLTLNMNKLRQASITNQIIEIVSGANA
ncbi:ATP synthase F1 subunit gamma [Mesoterricola silvestris]|uniref:ATP synthase gamma chain n=1 Tax=Mesoterricola silvestris TaxID=2927979 RepID=A0AA48GNA1_9BACT|nr:ATP synthase F1 subunit gamma [Mesoterricola silvestris]BDU71145.1 ATP synthase subunit gamma [Mesoterricola silvestris]